MKRIILCLLMMATSVSLFAQSSSYTYVSEKKYNVIHELDGEVFIPAEYQLGMEDIFNVDAGEMQITLAGNKVEIMGVDNLSTFHVLSKYPNRVGYIYELMSANGKAARLKVVTDQEKYVNLIYFYSKTLGEHTFFLAQKSKEEVEAEKSNYTPKESYFIRNFGNLVKKEVLPYMMVTRQMAKPEKVDEPESHKFSFAMKTVTTPKGTFDIKKSSTTTYKLKGYPAVRSLIEVELKAKRGIPNKVLVYLNFKQQIELIQYGDTRYTLMP